MVLRVNNCKQSQKYLSTKLTGCTVSWSKREIWPSLKSTISETGEATLTKNWCTCI